MARQNRRHQRDQSQVNHHLAASKRLAANLFSVTFTFKKVGCHSAASCDGSDSVFLMVNGEYISRQGEDKDERTTCGIGFRED